MTVDKTMSGEPSPRMFRDAHGVYPLLVLFLSFASCAQAGELPAAPVPARQQELVRLVRQDCGSCHGMRLSGGLGPALTVDALRDKPAPLLAATILAGRWGTPMPPWRQFLSEAEAAWIAQQLLRGFPE
jgi:cytochrome c55X